MEHELGMEDNWITEVEGVEDKTGAGGKVLDSSSSQVSLLRNASPGSETWRYIRELKHDVSPTWAESRSDSKFWISF